MKGEDASDSVATMTIRRVDSEQLWNLKAPSNIGAKAKQSAVALASKASRAAVILYAKRSSDSTASVCMLLFNTDPNKLLVLCPRHCQRHHGKWTLFKRL